MLGNGVGVPGEPGQLFAAADEYYDKHLDPGQQIFRSH